MGTERSTRASEGVQSRAPGNKAEEPGQGWALCHQVHRDYGKPKGSRMVELRDLKARYQSGAICVVWSREGKSRCEPTSKSALPQRNILSARSGVHQRRAICHGPLWVGPGHGGESSLRQG